MEGEQQQQQQAEPSSGQQQQTTAASSASSTTTATTTTNTATTMTSSQQQPPVFVFSFNGSSSETQNTMTPSQDNVEDDSQQQQPFTVNNNINDGLSQQQQQQHQWRVPLVTSSSSFVFRAPLPPSLVPTITTTTSGTGQRGIPTTLYPFTNTFTNADEQNRRTFRVRRMGPFRPSNSNNSGAASAGDIPVGIQNAGAGASAGGQSSAPGTMLFSIGSSNGGRGHGGRGGTSQNQNPRGLNGAGSRGRGVVGRQQQQQQGGVYIPGATININDEVQAGAGGGTPQPPQRVTFASGVGSAGGGGGSEGGRGGHGGQPMNLQFRVPSGSRIRLHRNAAGGGFGLSSSPMNNHSSMGMGSMGTTTTTGMVMSMGEIRVPPLQPLVMMDSLQSIRNTDNENGSSTSNNDNNNSHQDLERFKCTLCCEFMRVAHACGADQCDSRFCSDCVDKLAAAPINNNIHNNNSKRCPTCRRVVQGDFVRDESLVVDNIPPIPCRFQGCQERLKLEYVAAHEAICPMVQMCCKYKSFGCSWTGPRGELNQHEDHDCPLAKIRLLVEQHRVVHATQQHHFGQLNFRTQMAMQLAESHNQRIVQLERSTQTAAATAAATTAAAAAASNHRVSTSNPMDVLSFVGAILVSLPSFSKLEVQWRDFLTVEGRATVFNMTMMLSPIIVVGKLLFEFYARALQILGGATDDDQICPKTDDCGLFSGAMSLLSCILIASIFLRDNRSSRAWKFDPLPATHQFALDAVHLSATAFGLKFFGMFRGLILLWWALVSTVFFPTLLAVVSIKHARMGMPRPQDTEPFMSNLCDTGRAFYPIVFGFRTALPCVMFGPTAAAIALLLVEAIQPLFSHVPIGFGMKPYFAGSNMNRIVQNIALFIVACALIDVPPETLAPGDAALVRAREKFLNHMIGKSGRSLFAFVTVIATNLFIWSLSRFGMRLANKLIEWDPIRPHPGTQAVSKNSSVGGSVVVATWIAVLVFIAAT